MQNNRHQKDKENNNNHNNNDNATPNSARNVSHTSNINGSNSQSGRSGDSTLDLIKSGLMLGNTSLNKERKELTLAQLYLAFNKPVSADLNLKYDFLVNSNLASGVRQMNQLMSSTTEACVQPHAIGNNNEIMMGKNAIDQSLEMNSSSQIPLTHHQAQHQQFYFNAVATTAASFLNDIVKSKADAAAALLTNAMNASHGIRYSFFPFFFSDLKKI